MLARCPDATHAEKNVSATRTGAIMKRVLMMSGLLGLLLACGGRIALGEDPTPGYNTPIPPEIMTPDRVETTYLGTLEFSDGQYGYRLCLGDP